MSNKEPTAEQPQEGLAEEQVIEELTLLYCKWCPKDCQELTKEERIGCLAAGGFVDDFKALNFSPPQEVKDKVEEARREGIKVGHNLGLAEGQYTNHKRHGKKMVQARQEGREEVVDALNSDQLFVDNYSIEPYWQAKLKEWGISEDLNPSAPQDAEKGGKTMQMAHFIYSARDEPGDVILFHTTPGSIKDEDEFKSYNEDPEWKLCGIYELTLLEGEESLPGSMEQ